MPRITGSSLEEHRSLTRRRVFDALVRLLDRTSFDALSMADLAAEAGIGRTAIYNHFPDKDAVIVAFATSETQAYLDRVSDVLRGIDDPVERLRAYVRHHIETQGEQHFGFGPEVYGQLAPEARREIGEHVRDVESVLRSILREGVTSGAFRDVPPDQSIRLVHACLQPRSLEPEVVADFVVGAVSAPTLSA